MTQLEQWRVRGSYFEGCNCDAICPCRSVGGRPGGPSSFGICYGSLSWHIADGFADDVDISDLDVALSLRYRDDGKQERKKISELRDFLLSKVR